MLLEKTLILILERTSPFHYRWAKFCNTRTNWTAVYEDVKPTCGSEISLSLGSQRPGH